MSGTRSTQPQRGWSDPEGFYKISRDIQRQRRRSTRNPPRIMDPPNRAHIKRRAVSAQHISNNSSAHRLSDESSSHPGSKPKYGLLAVEGQPPRSRNQTVSVGWVEGDNTVSRRTSSLQFELAECVETKTITTTTTTKRSYPPLLIRQDLAQLDPKEYPLALQQPPPELLNFSYEVENHSTSQSGDSTAKLVSIFIMAHTIEL